MQTREQCADHWGRKVASAEAHADRMRALDDPQSVTDPYDMAVLTLARTRMKAATALAAFDTPPVEASDPAAFEIAPMPPLDAPLFDPSPEIERLRADLAAAQAEAAAARAEAEEARAKTEQAAQPGITITGIEMEEEPAPGTMPIADLAREILARRNPEEGWSELEARIGAEAQRFTGLLVMGAPMPDADRVEGPMLQRLASQSRAAWAQAVQYITDNGLT